MRRSTLWTIALLTATLPLIACGDRSEPNAEAPAADAAPATEAAIEEPVVGAPAAAAAGGDDVMHRGHRLQVDQLYVIAGTESGSHVQPEGCRDGCKAHATCVSWSWSQSILGPNEPGSCTWYATAGTPVATGDDTKVVGVIASKAG